MLSRRFSKFKVLFALPVLMALFAAIPAYSAPAEMKLAIVDVQHVMTKAKVTTNIQEQVDKQRATYQAELTKLEQELKATEQQLIKESNATASGDIIQKKADFEKKVISSKQLVQKRRNGLEKGATDAMNEVRKEILKIVSEISEKEKYDAVLTRQAVIVAAKPMDITEKVLKQLDSRLSKVAVKFDAN